MKTLIFHQQNNISAIKEQLLMRIIRQDETLRFSSDNNRKVLFDLLKKYNHIQKSCN